MNNPPENTSHGSVSPSVTGRGGETVTCPSNRACRLTLVNPKERLVYCVLLEPGICHEVMAFGDTKFCRALLGSGPKRSHG